MVGRGDEERRPPGHSVEPRPTAVVRDAHLRHHLLVEVDGVDA
jgi:hypothetical protein